MDLTTINGLPAHVLLVHFVVVLVPIAAIMLLFAVAWPAARRRLGIATPIVALVTLILVPLTTDAGQWLQRRVPRDPLVQVHAELGDQLSFWSFGVFAVAAAWWLLHDDRFTTLLAAKAERLTTLVVSKGVAITLIAAAVILSVGSVVQEYRIGDSGANAAWHARVTSALPATR